MKVKYDTLDIFKKATPAYLVRVSESDYQLIPNNAVRSYSNKAVILGYVYTNLQKRQELYVLVREDKIKYSYLTVFNPKTRTQLRLKLPIQDVPLETDVTFKNTPELR